MASEKIDPVEQRKAMMNFIRQRRIEIKRYPSRDQFRRALDEETSLFMDILELRTFGNDVPDYLAAAHAAALAKANALNPGRVR
jgi:hypothetical protein